jgi:hypothetical protein
VLLVAYGVIVTAIKVWLANYPVNWLGTAAESSPDPADSTQVITFAVSFLVAAGAATFALLGIIMAFVSALYVRRTQRNHLPNACFQPTRIVNAIISYRASVQSLSSSGAAMMTPRQTQAYSAASASVSQSLLHPHSAAHMMGSSIGYDNQAYPQ